MGPKAVKAKQQKQHQPDPESDDYDDLLADIDRYWIIYEVAISNMEKMMSDEQAPAFDVEVEFGIFQDACGHLQRLIPELIDTLKEEGNRRAVRIEKDKLIDIGINLTKYKVKVKRLVREYVPEVRNTPSTGSGSAVVSCRLPKIDVPKFNGDVRNWLQFWSQFENIDGNCNITKSDKFQYLIQSINVGTEAHDMVISYPISGDNYDAAISDLKERFGRKDLLVNVYVRDLLSLVISNAEKKESKCVTTLYTKLSAHLRALESLGVTQNSCAAIVYPIVESCLSEEILRAWQRDPEFKLAKGSEELLKKIMEFLSREVKGEVNIQLACGSLSAVPSKQTRKVKEVPTTTGLMSTTKENSSVNCLFCDKPHPTFKCRNAVKMTIDDKNKVIREKKACYKCLRVGHMKTNCSTSVKCKKCGRDHQTVMCHSEGNIHAKSTDGGTADGDQQVLCSSHSLLSRDDSEEILLQTLLVDVQGVHGKIRVRALIDSGSQKSYVLKSLALKLGLQVIGQEEVVHGLFGGDEKCHSHKRLKIYLSHPGGKYMCDFTVSDVGKITGKINSVPKGSWMDELKQKKITISDVDCSHQPISILIGADVCGKLLTGETFQCCSGPVAVNTRLGWTVMGKLPLTLCMSDVELEMQSVKSGLNVEMPYHVTSLHIHDMDIPKLWDLDVLGIREDPSKTDVIEKDEKILNNFMKTVAINEENRYVVKLPWISSPQVLPNNRWIAERRLGATTKKLVQQEMVEKYNDVFLQWERDGIIEEILDNNNDQLCTYIPHRAVVKLESSTTPIRPVFDASCRFKGQPSLNDLLETGPNMLEDILFLILQFRLKAVGVLADIAKAFLQISVQKKDQDFLRFLWWKDAKCTELKLYRHCRVVFGVKSSPFILAATLKHLFENCKKYKNTAKLLSKSFYVDNLVISVDTYMEATTLQNEARQLMSTKQFDLRCWEIGPTVEDKFTQFLGMTWSMKDDVLFCDPKMSDFKENDVLTKRAMLAITNSIFDPIGILCAYTIVPKMLLQEAWSLKLSWDSPVPDNIVVRFKKWMAQFPDLKKIKIPRWMCSLSSDQNDWSLHVFTDASQLAYGVCIFLRVKTETSTTVQLVLAKARVAPLKITTIPRLELIGCVVGARLASYVKKKLNLENVITFYWSDSSVALHWIQNHGNWGVFVQRRVEEIRRLSTPQSWRHIPGELNPADIPSRGATISQLQKLRWWEGIQWMYMEKENWPKSAVNLDTDAVNTEQRKSVVPTLIVLDDERMKLICKQTSYSKMLIFVAKQNNPTPDVEPNVEQMLLAEKDLFRNVQNLSFTGLDDTRLKKLDVFINEDGLICLKTRLDYGEFGDSFKFPVVLPGENVIVRAKIKEEHLDNSHGSVTFLLSKMRNHIWILKGRQSIRSVLKSCDCQRFIVNKLNPPAPPLPKNRIEACVPFQVTGVDLFGPLFLTNKHKVWCALFTCAVFRAVHLELVESISTEDFRAAFRRFVARRGKPQVIYSDNGPNFKGCDNAFKKVNVTEINKQPGFRAIEWKFNPPTASWWGGWFERIVGVVKQSLRRVIGKEVLTLMELQTALCDVECVVNQRPITYVSDDFRDPKPLTPYLFLHGNREVELQEANNVDSNSLNKRLRHLQIIRDNLKVRFQTEYLGQLISSRTKEETRQLSIGDIVLVGEDNRQRLNWKIGKIMELHPSRDGITRVVTVSIDGTNYSRPIQRIYPFEVEHQEEIDDVRSLLKTKRGGSVINEGKG